MYHLNRKLIERLPKLLRISKKELSSRLDIDSRQYNRWVENGYMPVKMLVRLANTVRIRLADFIVVHENPVQRPSLDSYVVSSADWKEVSWNGKAFHELLGDSGKLKISKKAAAERIGIASPQYFDLWSRQESGMDVDVLIRFLNEFKLDASLFFEEPNGPIPVPLWKGEDESIAESIKNELLQYKQTSAQLRDSERRLSDTREENARLKKEVEFLKKKVKELEARPIGRFAAESPVSYQSAGKTEWRFHKELWHQLPEVFEMTGVEFCQRFGIPHLPNFVLTDNIQIQVLVNVCNELCMSIASFFLRKGDSPVIHDRGWYEIPKRSFKPVVSHMERMEYIFGRWSVLDYSRKDLENRAGVGYRKSLSMSDNEKARVMTLTSICTEFGLSPMLFFEDGNQKSVDFFTGRNERLILNSMAMAEEIRTLRGKLKKDNSKS